MSRFHAFAIAHFPLHIPPPNPSGTMEERNMLGLQSISFTVYSPRFSHHLQEMTELTEPQATPINELKI